MKSYNFSSIEESIQNFWERSGTHKTKNFNGPKYYLLSMFPYPSGKGLHTGHLLGYYAGDSQALFKKMQGYNVLNPMGFDAFGLPAEQYAVETGAHPEETTQKNTANYRRLMERAGLGFDWSRSFATTDPAYYRWTQWIFLQFFKSWYNEKKNCAEPIERLIETIEKSGNHHIKHWGKEKPRKVTAEEWKALEKKEQEEILSHYRLAYLSDRVVNWCPNLGTVLANEEVKNGFSERGGHPVLQKKMAQWALRITPYIDRLIERLDRIDWPNPVKQMQKNWFGRSEGAEICFQTSLKEKSEIRVFTTRAETLFGATFLVLSPEHPMVESIIEWQKKAIKKGDEKIKKKHHHLLTYLAACKKIDERKQKEEKKEISGVESGLSAKHPITGKWLPICVADYVLSTYGSGSIMAVPAHDERDERLAKHLGLPIISILNENNQLQSSHFLDGLSIKEARKKINSYLEKEKLGEPTIAYTMHDPNFSRQRYWGEPFPIFYKEGIPYGLDEKELPLTLPLIDAYKPTQEGKPPLARAKNWKSKEGHPLECNTMPGWAGSSWYFLRYMDPNNHQHFASKEALAYWNQVDCYIGGAEHSTGHLIYARFFTKFLYDLGHLSFDEPFKKLINQGMIQGRSAFVYRIEGEDRFVSHGLRKHYKSHPMHVDIALVKNKKLDLEAFKKWRPHLKNATFVLEDGHYICGEEIEKMSKSKYNTVDPEKVFLEHGSDAFRMHLFFLGPITQSKPWSQKGLEGIDRFIKKLWQLFYNQEGGKKTLSPTSSAEEEKMLQKTIHAITSYLEKDTLNTCISQLMMLVNGLSKEKNLGIESAQNLIKLLAPFAPHLSEHLWQDIFEKKSSIFKEKWPRYDASKAIEESRSYVLSVNGKKKDLFSVPSEWNEEKIKAFACNHVLKKVDKNEIDRIIWVKNRMVNIVLKK